MSLNILDITILLIIVISTLLGIHKGFTKIVIGFFSLGLSFVLTYFIYPYIGKFLSYFIINQLFVNIISVIITYLIIVIILNLISSLIIKLINNACGSGIDKILGGGIGLIRGVLLVQAITTILIVFSSESYLKAKTPQDLVDKFQINSCADWLKNSYFAQPIYKFNKIIFFKISQKYLNFNYENLSLNLHAKFDENKILNLIDEDLQLKVKNTLVSI